MGEGRRYSLRADRKVRAELRATIPLRPQTFLPWDREPCADRRELQRLCREPHRTRHTENAGVAGAAPHRLRQDTGTDFGEGRLRRHERLAGIPCPAPVRSAHTRRPLWPGLPQPPHERLVDTSGKLTAALNRSARVPHPADRHSPVPPDGVQNDASLRHVEQPIQARWSDPLKPLLRSNPRGPRPVGCARQWSDEADRRQKRCFSDSWSCSSMNKIVYLKTWQRFNLSSLIAPANRPDRLPGATWETVQHGPMVSDTMHSLIKWTC